MNQSTVVTQFVAYATTVANIRRELLAIPGMRQAAEPVHQAAEQFYERALAYAAHALEVCVDALDDAYMEACDQATSRDQIPTLVDRKLDAWRRAGRAGSARVPAPSSSRVVGCRLNVASAHASRKQFSDAHKVYDESASLAEAAGRGSR